MDLVNSNVFGLVSNDELLKEMSKPPAYEESKSKTQTQAEFLNAQYDSLFIKRTELSSLQHGAPCKRRKLSDVMHQVLE